MARVLSQLGLSDLTPGAPDGAESHLRRALQKRSQLLTELGGTDVIRLIDGSADGFPGLTVDQLGELLLVVERAPDARRAALIEALNACFYKDKPIFFKQLDADCEQLRIGIQLCGEPVPLRFTVREYGLQYQVHLDRHPHIGLFLDARPARRYVCQRAGGRRVLNLFSYTSTFGVAAAAGGARSTTNVDNKRSALAISKINYDLNGLEYNTRTFLRSDIYKFLSRAVQSSGRYDLIVVDPPLRFRRASKRWFHPRQHYAALIGRCLPLLAPEGLLVAGLNAPQIPRDELIGFLEAAFERCGFELNIVAEIGAGRDFPVSGRHPRARFVVAELPTG